MLPCPTRMLCGDAGLSRDLVADRKVQAITAAEGRAAGGVPSSGEGDASRALGTVAYTAPEIFDSGRPSKAGDCYAFGIMRERPGLARWANTRGISECVWLGGGGGGQRNPDTLVILGQLPFRPFILRQCDDVRSDMPQ